MIIIDTEQLEKMEADVSLLVNAYRELLEYTIVTEQNLVAARIRWLYETEELPHKCSWIAARKELLPKARSQLAREMGYRGLSEK